MAESDLIINALIEGMNVNSPAHELNPFGAPDKIWTAAIMIAALMFPEPKHQQMHYIFMCIDGILQKEFESSNVLGPIENGQGRTTWICQNKHSQLSISVYSCNHWILVNQCARVLQTPDYIMILQGIAVFFTLYGDCVEVSRRPSVIQAKARHLVCKKEGSDLRCHPMNQIKSWAYWG